MKVEELALAEAQLIGFNHCSKGYTIKELANSMGLTKNEWVKLRDKIHLKSLDKAELDEIYKIN